MCRVCPLRCLRTLLPFVSAVFAVVLASCTTEKATKPNTLPAPAERGVYFDRAEYEIAPGTEILFVRVLRPDTLGATPFSVDWWPSEGGATSTPFGPWFPPGAGAGRPDQGLGDPQRGEFPALAL